MHIYTYMYIHIRSYMYTCIYFPSLFGFKCICTYICTLTYMHIWVCNFSFYHLFELRNTLLSMQTLSISRQIRMPSQIYRHAHRTICVDIHSVLHRHVKPCLPTLLYMCMRSLWWIFSQCKHLEHLDVAGNRSITGQVHIRIYMYMHRCSILIHMHVCTYMIRCLKLSYFRVTLIRCFKIKGLAF